MSEESARAFVPGHVTGFFSAHPHDDPRQAGSRGAGVTLSDGVTVEVGPADTTTSRLNDRSVSIDAVERVLAALDVTARVEAETPLPLGSGFGVSGATALGTALAANERFDCRRTENELVGLAHVADVESGTGLGDVVAQARGGVPIRLEPGTPEHNRLDGIPATARVEYLALGDLSTAEVLSGDTDRLSDAGEAALTELRRDPTLASFVSASRRFARDADLLTPRVEEVVEAVGDVGGEAAMAMLGETVFALGTGLTDAGYDAKACRIHPAGATMQTE